MNYLAHFHLSHGDDEWLVGALLGDYIKGPLQGRFSVGLEQGILLHRKVDAFTDQHPELKQCQQLFDPQFRRYASIMTDIAFDHFLNQHWKQFHHQALPRFSKEVYRLINRHPALPPPATRQAAVLAQYEVLESFADWRTVEGALLRVQQRLKRDNPLANAADEMQQHYEELEQIFLRFYPQLKAFADQLRADFKER